MGATATSLVTSSACHLQGGQEQGREDYDGVTVEHVGKATVISVFLTQAETLSFHADSSVKVQLRCKALGIAQATTIDTFKAEEILLEGEI